MSLIDDIKKDLEAGTSGPWECEIAPLEYFNVFQAGENGRHVATVTLIAHGNQTRPNARRIARVPDMEAALLAAEELAAALVEAYEETLWAAYQTGHERDGKWDHCCISDGEWLAAECGFSAAARVYDAAAIKAAIAAQKHCHPALAAWRKAKRVA